MNDSNRREDQSYRQQLQDLEALVRVIGRINRSLEVKDVLHTGLSGIQPIVEAEFGCFLFLRPDHRSLEVKYSDKLPPSLLEQIEKFSTDLQQTDFAYFEIQGGTTFAIGQCAKTALQAAGIESYVIIPLVTRNQSLGVLFFGIRKGKLLAPKSIDLLMSIGEQIGMAIENAQLYAKVKESEEWSRTFIENSPDAFLDGTLDGKIKFVNDAACQLFGYDRDALLGMNVNDLVALDEQTRLARLEELLKKGYASNPVVKYHTRTGKILSASVVTRVVRDQAGNPAGFQAIVRDVTKQQQAFDTVKQRNEELAALNTISGILSNPLDFERALDQVCEQIVSITNMESMIIYLVDETKQFLNIFAHSGVSEKLYAQMARVGLDDPMTRYIAVDGNVFATDDLTTYTGEGIAGPRSEGYRAGIAVPILKRDTPVGIIEVGSKTQVMFDHADIGLLLNIGRQIGKALENNELYEQMRQRSTELTALNIIADILNNPLDFERALGQVCEQITSITGMESAMIYFADSSQQFLDLFAYRGVSDNLLNQMRRVGLDDQITHRVAVEGHAEAFNDIMSYSGDGLAGPRSDGYHAGIAVPIFKREMSQGMLIVGSKNKTQYEQSDVSLLRTIGGQIGKALENSELYKQMQRRVEELSGLAQLSNACSGNLDPIELSKAAVHWTHQLVPADFAMVRLLENNQMRLTASYSRNNTALKEYIEMDDVFAPVFTQATQLLIHDIDNSNLPMMHRQAFRNVGIQSIALAPMSARNRVIGALAVAYSEPHHWPKNQVDLLQTIANQVASAIDNAQLFQNVLSEQRKVQAIFDSGLSGLFATDANGHIVMFNHAAERITGYSLDEVIGKKWEDLFREPSQEPPVEPLINDALFRKKTVFMQDGRNMLTRDGRVIPVAKAVAPLLDENQNVTGAVGAFWDLTREQAAELEREEFLKQVAHQLRSPLTAVLSALQLLERPNLSEERKVEMWSILRNDGERLKRFANQFLDLEAAIKSQRPVNNEPLAMAALARSLVKNLQVDNSHHRFHVVAASKDLMVFADQDRVENVLRNLLDNAISYSPADTVITITIKPYQENMVDVAVNDHGPGIPLQDQEKIFQPFYRSARAQKRSVYGHGLGLSIAKRNVEEMGGQIWVESKESQGATFHFTLKRYR